MNPLTADVIKTQKVLRRIEQLASTLPEDMPGQWHVSYLPPGEIIYLNKGRDQMMKILHAYGEQGWRKVQAITSTSRWHYVKMCDNGVKVTIQGAEIIPDEQLAVDPAQFATTHEQTH